MNWITFERNVRQWLIDKGIFANGTVTGQAYKLGEEFGELSEALAKKNKELLKDAIGDTCVTLVAVVTLATNDTIDYVGGNSDIDINEFDLYALASGHIADVNDALTISNQNLVAHAINTIYALEDIASINGLNIDECLGQAWHEIKDRKGHMNEQGVFIKEAES